MITLADRVRDRRTALRLTQKQLAVMAGVTQGTIGNIETGNRDAPQSIASIAKALGVRATWLLDGTGQMLDSQDAFRQNGELVQIQPWDDKHELSDDAAYVPKVELNLSAGMGNLMWQADNGQPLAFRKHYLKEFVSDPDKAVAMMLSGTSMEPIYQDGDTLLLDTSIKNPRDGKVFAYILDDEYFVKRIFKMPDGSLKLSADNPDKVRFPDRIIGAGSNVHFEIIGQVVGRSGRAA